MNRLATIEIDSQTIAESYALAFDSDNGSDAAEYIDRVSFDVYPAKFGRTKERQEFRKMMRAFLKTNRLNRRSVN